LGKRLREKILSAANLADMNGAKGESCLLLDPNSSHPRIAVVGLGAKDVAKEDIRIATALGVKNLVQNGATRVTLDPICGGSAIEGASLALYEVDQWKSEKKNKEIEVSLPVSKFSEKRKHELLESWRKGVVGAQAQQFSRSLMETPANLLTPEAFAQKVQGELSKFSTISTKIHDLEWIKQNKMGGVIGVSQGSKNEPKFLEIDYNPHNSDEKPLILIGKGVTFDSGGISIKPSAGMGMMKGDMGGAASVVAVMKGLGESHYVNGGEGEEVSVTLVGGILDSSSEPSFSPSRTLPVKCLVPLVENMPSGTAIRPGDVLTMMDGQTVEVDNTDAEGRLILADALTYAQTFQPEVMVDVATLTGAMAIALGEEYTGAFCTHSSLFSQLESAGKETGERMWRMPLDDGYFSGMKSTIADMRNAGPRVAGACTAAIFLKKFVKNENVLWAHLDIAGVMHSESGAGYQPKGMTGTPTRALLKFVQDFS